MRRRRFAVGAVVLESPFTSIAAVAQYHYPFVPAAWLVWDRYDSLSRIGQVKAPLLMLQGGRDGVVPARFRRSAVRRRAGAEGAMDRAARPGTRISAGFGALDAGVAFIERHVRQSEPASPG